MAKQAESQNQKTTKSFSFDFSTVEEYVPTGNYDLKVAKQEVGRTPEKDTPFIRITCEVVNDERYDGRTISHTFWITPKAMVIFRNALVAMGEDAEKLKGALSFPDNFLVGKCFNADVVTDEVFPTIQKIRAMESEENQ